MVRVNCQNGDGGGSWVGKSLRCIWQCTNRLPWSHLQPSNLAIHFAKHIASQTCFARSGELSLRKPPPATEPFRALRARNPRGVKNESKKSLPGPPVPKSPKRARKQSKTSQKGSYLTLFGLSFGLFGPLGSEGPGDSFWTRF